MVVQLRTTEWQKVRTTFLPHHPPPIILERKPGVRDPGFKTTRWLQDWFSLSCFRIRSIEYQEHLGTYWLKVKYLLVVTLQTWDSWTLSVERSLKDFFENEMNLFLFFLSLLLFFISCVNIWKRNRGFKIKFSFLRFFYSLTLPRTKTNSVLETMRLGRTFDQISFIENLLSVNNLYLKTQLFYWEKGI